MPSLQELFQQLRQGNRTALGQAISLVESSSEKYKSDAKKIVALCLPYSGNSLRIGISGIPGAGKSTFVENFGLQLIEEKNKVAVLTIDPSSSISKGSILGDKTRMNILSMNEHAFIRPSAAGQTLGGVHLKTRETIILCEAAGYNRIIIETVGIGQNEITVRSLSDIFLLMLIPGGGDELQGIKKGVVELCDLILINKSDGDQLIPAQVAKTEYEQALHYIAPATQGWQTPVMTISALYKTGLSDVLEKINKLFNHITNSQILSHRRKSQDFKWIITSAETELLQRFRHDESVKKEIEKIKQQDELPLTISEQLVNIFLKNFPSK